ncbi:MAG: D-2-hydroxyacid dehydrogenase [Deltaproteobacteria bacterium]|nr:D-2-hydroxyacid dehydrogenase [Deltaproteobacteria bacterium]
MSSLKLPVSITVLILGKEWFYGNMESLNVLIARKLTPELLALTEDASLGMTPIYDPAFSSVEVSDSLDRHPKTDVLFTINGPDRWSPSWRLRWIQLSFAGAEHLVWGVIPPNLPVTTASGANSVAMAEHAFALILALRRRINLIMELQAERRWPERRERWFSFAVPLLRDQTLGILGYGAIGREIGRLGAAFGMRVLAYKRNPQEKSDTGYYLPGTGDPLGVIPERYYGPSELREFFAESDVVVNILPATKETEGLVDGPALRAMKPEALFVNIGRGSTVREEDLIDVLTSKTIAGAALDVTAAEPLPPENPLWRIPNVIVGPHVGGFFAEYDRSCILLLKENLRRFRSGEALLNPVNRGLGY